MVDDIKKDLQLLANPRKAKFLAGFFKTGKGQYAEGDVFLGITVPEQREVAKKHINSSLAELELLLKSPIHEFRLTALLIAVLKYDKTNDEKIAMWFLKNSKSANNWDLVDLSADKILGKYLLNKDRSVLYKLAKSKNLWERRISIVSTFAFIRAEMFDDTLKICELLMYDKHDLIHKACGWMLREVGKREEKVLRKFLDSHSKRMPRTMLRYSIERLDEKSKRKYMNMINLALIK
ncbi:MAG: DNA alkylation repair protein [Nanoarchaeota archaeon]